MCLDCNGSGWVTAEYNVRKREEELGTLALRVPCPRCHQVKGDRCRNSAGEERKDAHLIRLRVAKEMPPEVVDAVE